MVSFFPQHLAIFVQNQIKADSRISAGRLSAKRMEEMLLPIINEDGDVVGAQRPSDYVKLPTLQFLHDLSGGRKISNSMMNKLLQELFRPVRQLKQIKL